MKFKISQDPIEVREYLEAQGFSLFKRRGIEKRNGEAKAAATALGSGI